MLYIWWYSRQSLVRINQSMMARNSRQKKKGEVAGEKSESDSNSFSICCTVAGESLSRRHIKINWHITKSVVLLHNAQQHISVSFLPEDMPFVGDVALHVGCPLFDISRCDRHDLVCSASEIVGESVKDLSRLPLTCSGILAAFYRLSLKASRFQIGRLQYDDNAR